MLPVEHSRRMLREAEAAYVEAARRHLAGTPTRESADAYERALESLLAATDTVRLTDKRYMTL